MKILIVYATYSGSTRIVGSLIEEVLKKTHETTLRNVFDMDPQELSRHDFVVLGSNSWFENKEEGQMNSGWHALKAENPGNVLEGQKTAIYALGDSNLYHNTFCKSAEHLEVLVKELGGEVALAPFKIDRFWFNEEENEQKVIAWAEELNQFLTQQQSH